MPNTQIVTASFTAPAAGDYTDKDVVSNHATTGAALSLGLAGAPGGSSTVRGGYITTSVPGVVSTFRLWLLRAAPHADTMKNDNVAFNLAIEDRANIAGFVDFDASVNAGEVSLGQVAAASLNRAINALGGSSDLYGILQVTSAFANETASMTFGIVLIVEHG